MLNHHLFSYAWPVSVQKLSASAEPQPAMTSLLERWKHFFAQMASYAVTPRPSYLRMNPTLWLQHPMGRDAEFSTFSVSLPRSPQFDLLRCCFVRCCYLMVPASWIWLTRSAEECHGITAEAAVPPLSRSWMSSWHPCWLSYWIEVRFAIIAGAGPLLFSRLSPAASTSGTVTP